MNTDIFYILFSVLFSLLRSIRHTHCGDYQESRLACLLPGELTLLSKARNLSELQCTGQQPLNPMDPTTFTALFNISGKGSLLARGHPAATLHLRSAVNKLPLMSSVPLCIWICLVEFLITSPPTSTHTYMFSFHGLYVD